MTNKFTLQKHLDGYAIANKANKQVITYAFFEDIVKYINMPAEDRNRINFLAILYDIICFLDSESPNATQKTLKEIMLADDFITANGLNKDTTEKMIDKMIDDAYSYYAPTMD